MSNKNQELITVLQRLFPMRSMILLLIAAAVSCMTGCASWPAYRFVEVTTSHTEGTSTNGMTAVNAERVFRHVANRVGFVVEGPVHVTSTQLEFSAREPGKKPKNPSNIGITIDERWVSFFVAIHGTSRDLQTAEGIAALFQEELDNLMIHYTVKKGKSSILAP